MEKINFKLIILTILTILTVYLGFKFILPLILPFIIAYFIAFIIRPITDFLCNKLKFSRVIAATLSLISLLTVFSIGVYYVFKIIIEQLTKVIRNSPIYLEFLSYKLEAICNKIDILFGLNNGSMMYYMDGHLDGIKQNVIYSILPKITEQGLVLIMKLLAGFGVFLIIIIASLLIVKDMTLYGERYRKCSIYKEMHKITDGLAKAGIGYLKAQGIIAGIVALICTGGLAIIKNEYSLILGIGIAVFDSFPVLGSGLILVPWSIIMVLKGDVLSAAILMTTYLACQIIRQVLEPKLLGEDIGVNAIITLISLYVGIKLFSFTGFILGPVGLIIVITVMKTLKENLKLT
ncbi:MAG TPA: sporulation integral membrane protein YtvI [Clostridiales bacterium]|nr:sporulation integral membrane protein YtvI [Clostridiales bacterium]